jgi:excisionase family DNA binding protein
MGIIEDDRHRLKGSGQSADIITAPIREASRITGLSRSEIYRRLATGEIRAVKCGTRTLILMDSLRAHIADLPAATFRHPKVL